MEVLNISTYPYNDPAARWSCRMEEGQVLVIIGSDQDRICLALTRNDARTLREHLQGFLAAMEEDGGAGDMESAAPRPPAGDDRDASTGA